jgi:uncharacterized protein (TIGR02145 family)
MDWSWLISRWNKLKFGKLMLYIFSMIQRISKIWNRFLAAVLVNVFFSLAICACSQTVSNSNSDSSSDEEIPDGWSWDVPKEDRMNPESSYGTMTDPRDNKTYRIATIGEQIWMAENLNYADSVATPSLKGRSWCYNGVAANCEVAGRLYTWAAAMDSVTTGCGYEMKCSLKSPVQGICPDGWHLPDSTDWRTLFKTLGGQITAAQFLKSQSGWADKGNGTDSVSFSALPGGYASSYEGFLEDGKYAYFWCSTDRIGGIFADYMYMLYYDTAALLGSGYKVNALSIRCLKD